MPESRRFPAPWTVDGNDACYWVQDATGARLAYVYFKDSAWGTTSAQQPLTRAEALKIARGIAGMAGLLG